LLNAGTSAAATTTPELRERQARQQNEKNRSEDKARFWHAPYCKRKSGPGTLFPYLVLVTSTEFPTGTFSVTQLLASHSKKGASIPLKDPDIVRDVDRFHEVARLIEDDVRRVS